MPPTKSLGELIEELIKIRDETDDSDAPVFFGADMPIIEVRYSPGELGGEEGGAYGSMGVESSVWLVGLDD